MTQVDASLATLLPGYEVIRELGRGAMGVVYLGRHRHLGREVAIKEIVGSLAANPDIRSRFRAEAKTLATLSHPHIVPVYDYVEEAGRCLLVMEAMSGGTVWGKFVERGLTLGEACALTLATCSAVQHAHDHGVLHRDIKPENLLLGADGQLRVADFGIAKVLNGARTLATADGSVLGTPAYMSPEQAEGGAIGPPTDVYAIGTMLYEFLSGRLPFPSDSPMAMLVQRITNPPPRLHDVAPNVPRAIADVVMRAIETDPARRYQSAEAFGRELATAATAVLGEGWLAQTAVEVSGSPALRDSLAAASTLSSRPTPPVLPPPRDLPPPGQVPSDLPPPGASTPQRGPDATVAVPGPIDPPASARSPEPFAPPLEPVVSNATVVVHPEITHHDQGFDAGSIEAGDLVDIAQVVKPPGRPWPALALGLAAVAAAIVVIAAAPTVADLAPSTVLLGGSALDAGPVELDLAEPIIVSGLPADAEQVQITFHLAGVPVAAPDGPVVDGVAEVDPGIAGYLLAGGLDVEVESLDDSGRSLEVSEGVVEASRAWYLSGLGILLAVLTLFAIAAAESQFDVLRKGRMRVKTTFNLAIAGAVLGAVGCMGFGVVVREPVSTADVLLAAVLMGAGFVALGMARAGFARRRRHRRAMERRATDRRPAEVRRKG